MKNLLYIGNKLSGHGFSVTTIETLGAHLEQEGFEVSYSSTHKNKIIRLAAMLWTTFKARNRIDYLLIDTYSTSNFWYAFLVSQLARLLDLKYIPILHGGNLPYRLKNNSGASGMIFKNSYKNVAPSLYLFTAFVNAGFKNTVSIPNSIEVQNYPFVQRSRILPKMLWVRAFAEIYHPTMAIEVFKKVKQNFPEASLCMVGGDKDGMLEKAKILARKYHLDITFTGQLPKTEWIKLSANYSVFLNTSRFDNMPISLIEAMALGLPIVSTRAGGIPDLLTHKKNALLVDNEAVSQMADAVISLVADAQLTATLSANAYQKAMEFDWGAVKNKWVELMI